MKAREVIRAIQRAGGTQTRQVGSHRRFRVDYTRPDGSPGTVFTTVPDHGGDIPIDERRRSRPDAELSRRSRRRWNQLSGRGGSGDDDVRGACHSGGRSVVGQRAGA
ncbi:type II toxin-antitoxin system HicA family toxin [Kribbella sp. VKM Ac-2571]|uniref:type II toxin-antitoxin system HicA family toxin n=1 Tax=Kribbella sp. VKM Ac-2571 TaxID=2512222 RepID=UPI00192DB128